MQRVAANLLFAGCLLVISVEGQVRSNQRKLQRRFEAAASERVLSARTRPSSERARRAILGSSKERFSGDRFNVGSAPRIDAN